MKYGYEEPSFDPVAAAIDGHAAHRSDPFADAPDVKRFDAQDRKTEALRNRLGRSVGGQALSAPTYDPEAPKRDRARLRSPE